MALLSKSLTIVDVNKNLNLKLHLLAGSLNMYRFGLEYKILVFLIFLSFLLSFESLSEPELDKSSSHEDELLLSAKLLPIQVDAVLFIGKFLKLINIVYFNFN